MSATPVQDRDLRYPVGTFSRPEIYGDADRRSAIAVIAALPENLRAAVSGLDESQLATPYRPGGWTVKQLVHHVADSHMNAYVRFKLALTEDWPTIKPYQEALWAELNDSKTLPIDVSLLLLDSLHRRWVRLLESLSESDWQRGYKHPESGPQSLPQVLALYKWHSLHHTAHVSQLRKRMNW